MLFSDGAGYQQIAGVNLLVNSQLQGKGGCWIYVEPSSKTLYLAADSGSSWSSAKLGSATVLQSSQCAVAANQVLVQGSGTQLSIAVAVQFKSAFSGNRIIYTRAVDLAGATSNYKVQGSWIVQ
jgi:hypothetical protein